ncbi:cytochrome P450 [Schizophyllum fasciatum]
MAIVTPGVNFIARKAFLLGCQAGLAGAGLHLLASFLSFDLAIWQLILGATLSSPILSVTSYVIDRVRIARRAAALGARLMPQVRTKLPGNLDFLSRMMEYIENGYPGDGLDELIEKYGPAFDINVLWTRQYFTTCPEHIKLILATDFANYEKGPRFRFNMRSVLGTGVFNSDGDMWKFHRSMTRPFFTRDRISHFALFDRHAEEAIAHIKQRLREGHPVDFADLFSKFTMDSATEFLFGMNVHSLSSGLPYPHYVGNPPPTYDAVKNPKAAAANAFSEAFQDCLFAVAQREFVGSSWPLREIWEDKTTKPMRVVNSFIEPIVDAAIKREQERQRARGVDADAKTRQIAMEESKEVEDDDTLLSHLVRFTSDPVVLKDETLNIMIAGRDTTAGTLSFIVYFLTQYPSVLARLREEVMTVVGRQRTPTYQDIREMKFMRAVINETLRLYPIVPFNTRQSIHETVWPSPDPNLPPIYVPAGTETPYSVFMMHRRKDLWGSDAEEFDPDRWLDERLQKHLGQSFAFLPFNAGPRICLGQQFAYNEMSYMMVKLLQHFADFALVEEATPPAMRPNAAWAEARGTDGRLPRKAVEKFFPKKHLTMYAGGGIWVRAKEAPTV